MCQLLFKIAGSFVGELSLASLTRKLRRKPTTDPHFYMVVAASFVLEQHGISTTMGACGVWIQFMPSPVVLYFVNTRFKHTPKEFYRHCFASEWPFLLPSFVKYLQSSVNPLKEHRPLTGKLFIPQEAIVDLFYQIFFSLGEAADTELSVCFAPHARQLYDSYLYLLESYASHTSRLLKIVECNPTSGDPA